MALRGSEEALLGFDAREMWLTGMREIGPGGGRPIQFLLRTDLDDVLSADTMVWPSIFKSTVTLDLGPELPLPEWAGMNVPFWEDLNALRNAIPQEFGQDHPFWLIAATWHTDIGFNEEERREGKILGPYIAPTTPQQRVNAWRFLGFDITDPGISGLSNCGYDDTERDGLAAEWGRHINRYHLFDSLERAFAFRTLTNARLPEHAPFFVIGLWLIAEITHG
ncbi:MAG: hypothetical protein ABSG25_08365 [Bryobacteraceae bacterium]